MIRSFGRFSPSFLLFPSVQLNTTPRHQSFPSLRPNGGKCKFFPRDALQRDFLIPATTSISQSSCLLLLPARPPGLGSLCGAVLSCHVAMLSCIILTWLLSLLLIASWYFFLLFTPECFRLLSLFLPPPCVFGRRRRRYPPSKIGGDGFNVAWRDGFWCVCRMRCRLLLLTRFVGPVASMVGANATVRAPHHTCSGDATGADLLVAA